MNNTQTEIERKRAAWWAAHGRPGMPLDEVLRLNEDLITLFPMTPEEREQRAGQMVDVEFVL
jgi:hypothetical protein